MRIGQYLKFSFEGCVHPSSLTTQHPNPTNHIPRCATEERECLGAPGVEGFWGAEGGEEGGEVGFCFGGCGRGI
ncbi:hypothetical protein M7I_3782 [Glarea lozoyensis 74030]|uniref:Uncharacterized protein n=1 Tax=Glarea lozoyensis (strain ATCC 74030 / MF5533) TaxID=1104152 RepID=H0EME6_GLAL7|nr:hypothetical protein M7I_3782 [Glarea lozoyensis 74030]